jgi:transcriptional regulator with XRE-family HTH domain
MTDHELTPAWYVRRIIERAGITQREAAKRLCISEAYLSDMLKSRRRIGPEMVELIVDRIETENMEAARVDLHFLGASADGWLVSTPEAVDG